MKKYLATVTAFLLLFAPISAGTSVWNGGSAPATETPENVQIFDNETGFLFEHNWRNHCNAKADIVIRGTYTVIEQNSYSLHITMPLRKLPQRVLMNVDLGAPCSTAALLAR